MWGLDLAGVVLHHQQFVDFQCDPLTLGATQHFCAEFRFVELEVGRHVGQAREFQVALGQLLAALAFAHGNDIAGLALIAGDVGHAAVHGDVSVVHQLAGAGHGRTKAESEADVVESVLEKFEQVGSGGTLLGTGFLHIAHQLALGDPVVEAEFLLFFESDRVFRALATGLAVLTGGVRPFCSLPGETW